MPTATQRTNLRLDLGLADDETVFTTAAIDALYTRAAALHPSDTALQDALVRVLAVRQLRNMHATLADYDQGESSEKLSQVFKHLDTLAKDFAAEYAALSLSAQTPMRFAKMKRTPSRRTGWPDA